MATSKLNKTRESTTLKVSNQSNKCGRCEEHNRLWLARCNTSDCSSEDQNSTRPATSKQKMADKSRPNVNVRSAANTVSRSSNEQQKPSETLPPPCPPTNIKQGKRMSKIPVRISRITLPASKMTKSASMNSLQSSLINRRITSGDKMSKIPRLITTRRSVLPKQNTTIENSTQATNDQEDNEVNHHDDQELSVMPDRSDYDNSDFELDQATANSPCVDISQSNMMETKEEGTKTGIANPEAIRLNLIKTIQEEKSEMNMAKTLIEGETKADISFTDISRSDVAGKQDKNKEKVDLIHTKSSHLYTAEIEDKPKALSFTNIVGNLSLSNNQNNYYNDSISEVQPDNDNNSIFTALMKEQAELKAYYDSFPNIDNAMDEVGPNIQKAKEFTESILRKLPSGDVDDRDTLCHVLKNLLGTEYQECLFYDSENGITLHDASLHLADINSQDRPFVLKLNSSEGLGNRNNLQSEQDDFELVQILRNVIAQKQSHPVIEDIIERLSKAHDVSKDDIVIKTLYVGSFDIVYTVMDLPRNLIKSLFEISKKLKKQFKQFLIAKIHPLLHRPSFDIAYFDDRGNKSFPSTPETHEVGPPGRTKSYITPSEWTRYGLKVLDKYINNEWLHPFQHPGNWYRAFHGTGRASSEDFGDKNQSFDMQYASVDALSSIYLNDFRKARIDAYGEGVYCSPNPQFPEQGYVQAVPLDTQKGAKRFKCMLQVAVNPDGVKFTKDNDIWVVPDPKDIRPYGILIKEA